MADVPKRFLDKVRKDENTDCWLWTGASSKGSSGGRYGHFSVGKQTYKAHRFIYEQVNGPIEDGKEIDHLCENTLCVNPEHLEAVEKLENMRRSAVWDYWSSQTHCKRGHLLEGDNVRVCHRGWRHCRACERIRSRERRQRLREA